MIIQIIGLPGSGKTSLAVSLSDRINAIHLNADYVRATINSDLGFSIKNRVEHARRLGEMARLLSHQGHTVIVDFVCPTSQTRKAFGKSDILIWMNRITESRFADTNAIWEQPIADLTITAGITVEEEVILCLKTFSLPDWKAPTTLMLGRYQPWHEGHQALKEKAYERTEQVVIAVRDTQGTSDKDPLSYKEVLEHIVSSNARPPMVIKVPNITNIVYGRDVGYKIEQIDLGADIHAISATQKRKEMGI